MTCANLVPKQTLVNDVPGVQTDYSAGFVYENDVLDFIQFAEGRVRPITPIITQSYQYEYDLTDHLGNVRATFKTVEGYDPDIHSSVYGATLIQADDYYPFGLKMPGLSYIAGGAEENSFTYNGKELEDEFGLNWYHYGVRFYDPAVGRWWSVDPAEEFHSPYTYVGNNPIMLIDPDGASSSDPPGFTMQMLLNYFNNMDFSSNGSSMGLFSGLLDGAKVSSVAYLDTGLDFFKSLGSVEGWKNLGNSAIDQAFNPPWEYIPKGWNYLKEGYNYWTKEVPNMSGYEFGYSWAARTTPNVIDTGLLYTGYRVSPFLAGRAPVGGKIGASVFRTGPLSYNSRLFGFRHLGGGMLNQKSFSFGRIGWSYHEGNYMFRVGIGTSRVGSHFDYFKVNARWGNTIIRKNQ